MEVVALIMIVFIAVGLQRYIFNRYGAYKLKYLCRFSAPEAYEGQEVCLVETLYNRKLLPVPWLKVDIHSSKWLDFAGTRSVITQEDRRVTSSFLLKSHQKITRHWKVICLKRGVFTTKNVTLIWGDLLGMGSSSEAVEVNAVLIVYPGIIDLASVFIPVNCLQGDVVIKRWIMEDPFIVSGTREYTEADSMNRIHWQSSARHGRLMVRKNDFTSRMGVTAILNMQSGEFEHDTVLDKSKIELGIKTAATLLDSALKMGMTARLAANGCIEGDEGTVFTKEAGGREHIFQLLKLLAQLKLENKKDFESFLAESSDAIMNNQIFIITCYINEEICRISDMMRRNGNRVLFFVLDEWIPEEIVPRGVDTYILGGEH